MNASTEFSGRIIEVDYERSALLIRYEGVPPEVGTIFPKGAWQPIQTAPKHEEVLVWREDAGTMLGIYTYCADQGWLSEKEQDEMDEETLFKEDWWWFGPHGVCRMEGSEVPTHWMPLPEGPASS